MADKPTTEANAETAAGAEETAPAEEQNAPAEAAEGAEGEAAAEGEQEAAADDAAAKAAEEKAKPPEPTEEQIRAAALKFANRTMAAARRAEQAVTHLKTENERLQTQVKTHDDFVKRLQTNPFQAIRDIGFKSLKEFVDKGREAGEPKEPTADDRVTQLEKLLKERDEREAQRARETEREASRGRVFQAIGKLTDRYDLAATEVGNEAVWDGIEEYARQHGEVPDDAVWAIADEVERELTAKFANVRKFKSSAQAEGAKAQPAAGKQAAIPAKKSGKTIASASQSGSPVKREYAMSDDERRRQVMEDMRAAGEL